MDAIGGVNRTTIENVVAEIGADMSQFPDEDHLSSWAGICPGNEESAGKRLRNRTTRKNRWLRRALTEAAWAAGRTKNSYLDRLKERPCHRNHIHMRAEANETKASWTGPSRSVRNRSLRKLCSHDKVRSATQR